MLDGGGIYNTGNMIIINCEFINNTSGMGIGGAIYNDGSIDVMNCVFEENYYTGIYNGSSETVNIKNCPTAAASFRDLPMYLYRNI